MSKPSVAIVTLGCARNEVDSDEVAAALAEDGWELVDDAEVADTVLVNTCGFIEQAKADSIETVLELGDVRGKVVAIGCMAERYGKELAAELPEADAVLGFDAYPHLPQSLRTLLAGGSWTRTPHTTAVVCSPPVPPSARLTSRCCRGTSGCAAACTRGPSPT